MLPGNYSLGVDSLVVETVKQIMTDAFMLQFGAKAGKFEYSDKLREKYPFEVLLFEGIERLGYVTDAYHFYRSTGSNQIIVQILGNTHDHLVRLSKDIVSLEKVFYTPKIQQKVEEYLKAFEATTWPKLD
jgi:hypothetical protein